MQKTYSARAVMIFLIYRDLQLWSEENVTRKTKQPKQLPDSAAARHDLNPAEPADRKIALSARLNTCLGPQNAG